MNETFKNMVNRFLFTSTEEEALQILKKFNAITSEIRDAQTNPHFIRTYGRTDDISDYNNNEKHLREGI